MMIALVLGAIIAYAAYCFVGYVEKNSHGASMIDAVQTVQAMKATDLLTIWAYPPSMFNVGVSVLIICAMLLLAITMAERVGKFDYGREYGDARWATAKELAKVADTETTYNNITYLDDAWLAITPVDGPTRKQLQGTWLNTCVVGTTGAGKGYRYVEPLIMQLVGNALPYYYPKQTDPVYPPIIRNQDADPLPDNSKDMLVIDTKGDTLRECGWLLEAAGYEISVFDGINFDKDQYNPFLNIPVQMTDVADIDRETALIRWRVDGTEGPEQKRSLNDKARAKNDYAQLGTPQEAPGLHGVVLETIVNVKTQDLDPLKERIDDKGNVEEVYSKDLDLIFERLEHTGYTGPKWEDAVKTYSYTKTEAQVSITFENRSEEERTVDAFIDFGPYFERAVSGDGNATRAGLFMIEEEARIDASTAHSVISVTAKMPPGAKTTLTWVAPMRRMRVPDTVELIRCVECQVANLRDPNRPPDDPFWENAVRLCVAKNVSLMFEMYADPEDRNIGAFLELMELEKVDMQGTKSGMDLIMEEWESGLAYDPLKKRSHKLRDAHIARSRHATAAGAHSSKRSFALHCYKTYTQGAVETLQSILISVGTYMLNMYTKKVQDMTAKDTMDLASLGEKGRRRAIFCIVDDMDHTYDFLFAMMIYQTITLNAKKANRVYGGKLERQLHLVLDELANIATIPNFERTIATTRSRDIVIHILLQSLNQLTARYGDNAATIRDNCSQLLFLGGASEETLKGLEELAGEETIEEITTSKTVSISNSMGKNRSRHGRSLVTVDQLRRLDADEGMLMIAAQRPFKGRKFQTDMHPLYPYIYSDTTKHPRPKGTHPPLFNEPWTWQGYQERGRSKKRAA